MDNWLQFFHYDPLPPLQKCPNPALSYFLIRDLIIREGSQNLNPDPALIQLWELPEAKKILDAQLPNGSWPDPRVKQHSNEHGNYNLVETYRHLGILVSIFGFTKDHPAIDRAKNYILSTQTPEGDFRGFYANQYSTNYTGGILELLVRAGYYDDPPIIHAFNWFEDHQQDDGGWVLPMQTARIPNYENEKLLIEPPIPFPSKSLRGSHMVTGIVIRAFAQHPKFSKSEAAMRGGDFLASRVFLPDAYTSRAKASYWYSYSIPFWWTDLISTLDALAGLGFSPIHPQIARILLHFQETQLPTGLWALSILKGKKMEDLPLWGAFFLLKAVHQLYKNEGRKL